MSVLIERTDDYVKTAVAVRPRRRDWWRVLTGRYEPELRTETRLTRQGTDKLLKEHYTGPIAEALNQPSAFLQHFDKEIPSP